MSFELFSITPFLIALVGGIIAGLFLFRPFARFVSNKMELEPEAAIDLVRSSSLSFFAALFFLSTILVLFVHSSDKPLMLSMIAYLLFLHFSAFWGVSMGTAKRFISLAQMLKDVKRL
jgi:hypothetical protein